MTVQKIADYNEKKLKSLFHAFSARFTKSQHMLITLAIVILILVICIFCLTWPVQMFIYYILLVMFCLQFGFSWYTHASRHAKEEKTQFDDKSEEDINLAEETIETIERRRRRMDR